MVTKKGETVRSLAHPIFTQNVYGLQLLFESGESDPLKLPSFDSNKDHVLLAQAVMIRGAIIVNSVTIFQPVGILQGIPEVSSCHFSLTSLQGILDQRDGIMGMTSDLINPHA